jgi:adenine deaminase
MTLDATECFVSCGFIESHLHVEGLHLLPEEYGHVLISHGTTTIITDLHEIANAGGLPAMEWYLSRATGSPVDLFIMAPSCVPSSKYETGGATIGMRELRKLRSWRSVIGIGEVMDLEGVMNGDKRIMDKIALFRGRPIDGHGPGLSGHPLDLYLSAGIHSDHETSVLAEGEEKLSKGVHLFLREGSVAKDLDHLLPLIRPKYLSRLSLCTDDLSARDLFTEGHLEKLVGRLVRSGLALTDVLRLVTVNPATYFGLSDRNSLAIGRKADLVVFSDPQNPRIEATIKDGKVVYRRGKEVANPSATVRHLNPTRLNVAIPAVEQLRQPARGSEIRVIGVAEGSIITDDLTRTAQIADGFLAADPEYDVLFAYVFDRFGGTGKFGFGFVTGFSLKGGAIGSTYAHDSHNLIVVGDNVPDIHGVATSLRDCGGGMGARCKGTTILVPMPYYGMISDLDSSSFLHEEEQLLAMVRRMGVSLKNPFFQMSFLSLPVVPRLRLTTKGLFDVTTSYYVAANS